MTLRFTKKTYYGLGIVAAALGVVGGALLIGGTYAALLYNIATLLNGCMFLCLASSHRAEKLHQGMDLAALVLLICSLVAGLPAKLGGALAFPCFVWPYFKESAQEDSVHTLAFVVLLCGGVQLVFSFLPMTAVLAACLSIAIVAAQGVFCWFLFHSEHGAAAE